MPPGYLLCLQCRSYSAGCSMPVVLCLCSGNDKGTRGTAFVVYEDIYDAKQALEHLGGFNVQNRYLILQVGVGWVQTSSRRSAQAGAVARHSHCLSTD